MEPVPSRALSHRGQVTHPLGPPQNPVHTLFTVTGFEGLFRPGSVAFGFCPFPARFPLRDVIALGGNLRLSCLGHFLPALPARFALCCRHLLLPLFSKVQQVALLWDGALLIQCTPSGWSAHYNVALLSG